MKTPSEVDENLLKAQAKNFNKDGNVFIYKLIMMGINVPSYIGVNSFSGRLKT